MQRYTNSMRLEKEDFSSEEKQDDFTCGECGKAFQKPILATDFSNGQIQKYHACPRCLTQVQVETERHEDEEETSVSMEAPRKSDVKLEDAVECKHSLGYLKNRPKNTAIPDECLTCVRMVECLSR